MIDVRIQVIETNMQPKAILSLFAYLGLHLFFSGPEAVSVYAGTRSRYRFLVL